jgi:hypothetical protein
MCVYKNHAFIYFMRPPPWYGTLLSNIRNLSVPYAAFPLSNILQSSCQISCCLPIYYNVILLSNIPLSTCLIFCHPPVQCRAELFCNLPVRYHAFLLFKIQQSTVQYSDFLLSNILSFSCQTSSCLTLLVHKEHHSHQGRHEHRNIRVFKAIMAST